MLLETVEVYKLDVTATRGYLWLNIIVINLLSLDLNTNNTMKWRIPVF